MSLQEHAEALSNYGYTIFPVEPGGKTPIIQWGTQSTHILSEVTSWWEEFPEDNIGINCGESGILVIDIDSADARKLFAELWQENEKESLMLIDSPVVKTRRGWHLYFNQPYGPYLRNTAGKLGKGIDTRAKGGMVIAPGSVVSGSEYRVVRGNLGQLAPPPEWLVKLLTPERKAMDIKEVRRRQRLRWPKLAEAELRHRCQLIRNAPDGEQNKTIYNAAFRLSLECCPPLDLEDVRHDLELAAEHGNHPRERAVATIDSGLRAGQEAAAEEDDAR